RELRGMREAGGLGLELLVLARLEARTLDLLELEAQEIRAALELSPAARALLDLAPHGLQRPMQLRHPRRLLLRACERVEGRALLPAARQGMVLVLAVQVHEGRAELPDDPGGRGRAVHPSTVPSLGRHLAAEHEQPVLGAVSELVEAAVELV